MEKLKTVSLNSLAEYINIPNKDSNTLYFIESDTWEVVTNKETIIWIK